MPNPITLPMVALLLAGLQIAGHSQACPKILACPNATVSICDISTNDPTLWQSPGFTWSPLLNNADLPETSADLLLQVRDNCPGALSIQFTLFLDLDGDNLAESVLNSEQTLPPGKMLFGNAFTPGYSGPDTLEFDNRNVPDSLKFRFTVEIQYSGDTARAYLRWATDMAPSSYLSPRFPEGKHRLIWSVKKNGAPAGSCDMNFRVKDCMAPQLSCRPSWNANMPNADTLWLSAPDFLAMASDNTTPDSLLSFSMRRTGAGTGFPVNNQGQPVSQLPFTCADLGLQFVEIWVQDLAGNTKLCGAEFVLYDLNKTCNKVDPIVCATAIFGDQDTIQDIQYKMEIVQEQGLPPVHLDYTILPGGCILLPDFSPYFIDVVGVTPRKYDNPLNGLSTFDLVLINRHILGIQTFDKTWKFLAADANNSGSLTTFDIIELRKLILGIYDSLPNSTSWKFYIANCALDSINPFKFTCPGTLVFDPETPPEQYLFRGIKTGDVNGNAITDLTSHTTDTRSPEELLQVSDRKLAAGETFEIDLTTAQAAEWAGCQGALTWDPELLEISTVETGQLPGTEPLAWAMPKPDALHFSWFDAEGHWLLPGTTLLRLRGRALAPVQLSDVLQFSPERLEPEAYSASGETFPLELIFPEKSLAPQAVYPPQPNPTRAGVVFPISLEKPAACVLEIWDARGQLTFQTRQNLDAGAGKLEVPESADLTTGVYVWRVQVGDATKTGRLIRL